MTSPTFTIMSAFDWWSSKCILFAEPVRAGYGPSPFLEGEGMNGNCTYDGASLYPRVPFCMGTGGTKRVLEYSRLAMGFAHVRASRYGIR